MFSPKNRNRVLVVDATTLFQRGAFCKWRRCFHQRNETERERYLETSDLCGRTVHFFCLREKFSVKLPKIYLMEGVGELEFCWRMKCDPLNLSQPVYRLHLIRLTTVSLKGSRRTFTRNELVDVLRICPNLYATVDRKLDFGMDRVAEIAICPEESKREICLPYPIHIHVKHDRRLLFFPQGNFSVFHSECKSGVCSTIMQSSSKRTPEFLSIEHMKS